MLPHAIAFGEHPHRDHRREVERRDPGDDAERLADLVDVDAGRRLLAEAALQQVRDAARELDVLEAAGDLAERVGRDLAVLGGQQRRDLVAVRVDQVPDPEEDLGPLRERRRPPGRERTASARPRRRRPPRPSRSRPRVASRAGRRVVDRTASARRALDCAPADPVVDVARLAGTRRRSGAGSGRSGLSDLCHRRTSSSFVRLRWCAPPPPADRQITPSQVRATPGPPAG